MTSTHDVGGNLGNSVVGDKQMFSHGMHCSKHACEV